VDASLCVDLLALCFALRFGVLEAMMLRSERLAAANDALAVSMVAQLRLALMRNRQMAELVDDFLGHSGKDNCSQRRNARLSTVLEILAQGMAGFAGLFTGGAGSSPSLAFALMPLSSLSRRVLHRPATRRLAAQPRARTLSPPRSP